MTGKCYTYADSYSNEEGDTGLYHSENDTNVTPISEK